MQLHGLINQANNPEAKSISLASNDYAIHAWPHEGACACGQNSETRARMRIAIEDWSWSETFHIRLMRILTGGRSHVWGQLGESAGRQGHFTHGDTSCRLRA